MRIDATSARDRLGELLERVHYQHERAEITRRGKVFAVVISPEEAAVLDALEDKALSQMMAVAVAEDDGYRIDADSLRRDLGL